MKAYWDLDTNQLVRELGSTKPPRAVEFKYRSWHLIQLFLIRDGEFVDLEDDSPIFTFGIKAKDKFDGDLLVESSDFTWNADEECYEAEPSFSATSLRDAIKDNGDPSDDKVSVAASGEFQYVLPAAPADIICHAGFIEVTLRNKVVRGDEDDLIDSGAVYWRFLSAVTGLTGGGSTNLDGALSPSSANVGSIVFLYVSSEPQYYRLFTGTDAEDAPNGIVRPDNFNASTNAVVWKRIA